jgi:hypothetical protein
MIECIKTAYEETNESRMFSLYCAVYPLMTKENFISFEKFAGKEDKKEEKKEIKKKKTTEEILQDVELITLARR